MPESLVGRIGQLVRANLNALLDAAEDPEKMLDQLVRDYTSHIAEAESAVAQTIANLRLLEDDQREAQKAVDDWGQKAMAASRKGDELRAGGQAVEADRLDELAKVALRRQLSYEDQARTLETQVAQQTELAEKLKDGLGKLRVKREELVQKRDELVTRARMAHAQIKIHQAMQNVSAMDPASELGRFEDRIRREEAMAQGLEEVSRDSLEAQFEELEASEDERELESRFARLKAAS